MYPSQIGVKKKIENKFVHKYQEVNARFEYQMKLDYLYIY